MKIGEFARKFNVSVPTVRYYINLGLLVPDKDGFQYSFTDNDCREMEIISTMKNSGFKLEELSRYLTLLRFYNKDDYMLYEKLIEFLEAKLNSLHQESLQINSFIHKISEEINRIEAKALSLSCDDQFHNSNDSESSMPGFPLNAIGLLYCPHCRSKLALSGVDICDDYITSGELSCKCGYHASIINGVLFTESSQDLDSDQQFLDSYFGRDNLVTNEDGMLLMGMNDYSSEYMTSIHKSSLWMHKQLETIDARGKTILLPDISCQYLYSYYDNADSNDNIFIVTALTERTIRPMRHHIANARPDFKAVYIINTDGRLPLKPGSIDMVIDYLGTCNLSFFLEKHYFTLISECIADDAVIAGTVEYYNANSSSIKKIHQLYVNAAPDVFTHSFVITALEENNFEITTSEIINTGYEPGKFFEYHIPGDIRTNMVYMAKKR